MFHFSLKTKMSVAVSLLVIVLMACGAIVNISHFDRRFKETIAVQQYALITEMARDIDETVTTRQQAIISVAKLFPPEAAADPARAQRFLDNRPTLRTLFDNGVFLFSPSGRMMAEYPDRHRRGTDYSFRDYFRKTMETGQPLVSEPYLSSQAHHHPAVMFTTPIFGRRGGIVAVLAGSLDLTRNNFFGHHSRARVGKTGYVYLFNSDRIIVVHPDRNRILQREDPVGVNQVVDKAIAGFDGTGETANSQGERTLTSVRHLKTVNWILAANYPLAEAYEPMREATRYSIIATVIGGVLTIIVVWLIMKVFTAPLLMLTSHIRKLAESEKAEKEIRIGSGDEIGKLAAVFNEMMRKLGMKQEELRKLSRAVEQSASLVIITDTNGDIVYVNPKFNEVTGYGTAEVIGLNPRILKSGEMPKEVYRQLWQTITGGGEWQGEFHNRKKSGELYWAGASISAIKNDRGEITHFVAVQEDITARKQAEEAVREVLRQQQAILDNIPDIAWLKDRECRFIAVNGPLANLCGRSTTEIIGKTDHDVYPPDLALRYREDDLEVMGSGRRRLIEEPLVGANGRILYVETIKTPVFNDRGEVIGTTGIARDITARREAEAQLRHLSTHDMLTGLYNRAFFDEEVKRLARGRQFPVSIIMADVDGLKNVNDSRGHEAGDRLLLAVARILFAAFRAEDVVARLGGDEFAVLLPETDTDAAEEAVQRIREQQDAANATITEFAVSLSLGAATAESAEDIARAMKLGDERMYREKFARKGMPQTGQSSGSQGARI